ncbi:MAG: amidohydrolase family protein [Chloroflexi bacterium]|nr:amidohydrolase family protein [Chloroflexota bacterium]
MKTRHTTKSAEIRARLGHPVIDADGHLVEFLPPLEDYVKAIAGSSYAIRWWSAAKRTSAEEDQARRDNRTGRPNWWGVPTKKTLDRATAALPKLLYERMDDLGWDFTVLFPTGVETGIGVQVYRQGSLVENSATDPEVERVLARAFNAYRIDICREYADRMTPVAWIPMRTPQAAIEDLEYAVKTLGMKVAAIRAVRRPVPAIHRKHPELFPAVSWLDTFGLDSAYDYDPFWATCVELKVPVLSHGNGKGFTGRSSPSNFIYNHIGNFADAGEAVCKSLFMAGVTRRFPALKFGFMEGGVAWACRLYSDLVGHWEKRNVAAMQNYNPANLDRDLFLDLHRRYGDQTVQSKLDLVLRVGLNIEPDAETSDSPQALDEWAPCRIERAEDIRDLFVSNFFFGCESDDPTNALAFNSTLWPFGARLQAIFSSDIGHWDVPDMTVVMEEAHELVEDGRLAPDAFRDFVFTNAVRLFAGMDPDFFKGTRIEKEAAKVLAARPS